MLEQKVRAATPVAKLGVTVQTAMKIDLASHGSLARQASDQLQGLSRASHRIDHQPPIKRGELALIRARQR